MRILSCPGNALGVAAPPRILMPDLSFPRLGGAAKDILLGFLFAVFTVSILNADEFPQGWVPAELTLPEDAEVQMDRAIGSSIRMFSFSTEANVDKLFGAWSSALEDGGFNIRPQQDDLEQNAIEFTGGNILNAKIAMVASDAGDQTMITFDATLE